MTFLACTGYVTGNFVSGNADDLAFSDSTLSDLGLTGTGGTWLEKIDGLRGSSTLDFSTPLTGVVFFAIHKGGAGQGGQGTAWYKVDVGAGPVDSITYNLRGSSNAALYAVSAVPEPGTYALMLLGIAGVAAAARRRRPA